jgi:hypothetical protein
MYEPKHLPPISTRLFAHRVLAHICLSQGLVIVSLLLGMAGFHFTDRMAWLDAFVQSAMLLGGMGPVIAPVSNAGKLFAGSYALYCGLVFIVVAGLIVAPVIHRILHRLHWDEPTK